MERFLFLRQVQLFIQDHILIFGKRVIPVQANCYWRSHFFEEVLRLVISVVIIYPAMKKNLLLITLSMIILSGCTLQEKMINENDPSLAKNLSGQKDPDQARFSLIKTDQAEAGKTVSG